MPIVPSRLPRIPAVYVIKSTTNGKMYIGSSCNLRRRIRDHLRNLERGTHKNKHLQSAFNKYGGDTFEVETLDFPIRDRLYDVEQFYLDKFDPNDRSIGFNRSHDARYLNMDTVSLNRGLPAWNRKGVVQMDMNGVALAEFNSMREAAFSIGKSHGNISLVCSGVRKSAYGYLWKYKE